MKLDPFSKKANTKAGRSLYRIDAATHCGRVRESNEDNYSVNGSIRPSGEEIQTFSLLEEPVFLAVYDGMGGEFGGELASRIAAEGSAELAARLPALSEEELTEAVNNYVALTNNRICDLLNNSFGSRGGSTLAMACFCGNRVYPYSLGDSRIYVFDGETLHLVTADHTVAMNKYRMNIYTQEQAEQSPDSHMLMLFLGVDTRRAGLKAEYYPPFALADGMKILLCSDGLYDMCSAEEISLILSAECGNYAEALVNQAMENGGADNITCIVAGMVQQNK